MKLYFLKKYKNPSLKRVHIDFFTFSYMMAYVFESITFKMELHSRIHREKDLLVPMPLAPWRGFKIGLDLFFKNAEARTNTIQRPRKVLYLYKILDEFWGTFSGKSKTSKNVAEFSMKVLENFENFRLAKLFPVRSNKRIIKYRWGKGRIIPGFLKVKAILDTKNMFKKKRVDDNYLVDYSLLIGKSRGRVDKSPSLSNENLTLLDYLRNLSKKVGISQLKFKNGINKRNILNRIFKYRNKIKVNKNKSVQILNIKDFKFKNDHLMKFIFKKYNKGKRFYKYKKYFNTFENYSKNFDRFLFYVMKLNQLKQKGKDIELIKKIKKKIKSISIINTPNISFNDEFYSSLNEMFKSIYNINISSCRIIKAQKFRRKTYFTTRKGIRVRAVDLPCRTNNLPKTSFFSRFRALNFFTRKLRKINKRLLFKSYRDFRLFLQKVKRLKKRKSKIKKKKIDFLKELESQKKELGFLKKKNLKKNELYFIKKLRFKLKKLNKKVLKNFFSSLFCLKTSEFSYFVKKQKFIYKKIYKYFNFNHYNKIIKNKNRVLSFENFFKMNVNSNCISYLKFLMLIKYIIFSQHFKIKQKKFLEKKNKLLKVKLNNFRLKVFEKKNVLKDNNIPSNFKIIFNFIFK